MSYSRWGDSRWYTYWAASPPGGRDNQIFEICGVTTFIYKDLKSSMDLCLNRIREIDINATEEEIQELKEYMNDFIAAVDRKL